MFISTNPIFSNLTIFDIIAMPSFIPRTLNENVIAVIIERYVQKFRNFNRDVPTSSSFQEETCDITESEYEHQVRY